MATNVALRAAGRLPLARYMDRLRRPRSYPQHVSLVCCGVLAAGTLPWIALAALNGAPLTFIAFALGTLTAICGLFHLVLSHALQPVQLALDALCAYRSEARVPNLPTTQRGAAGLLLARLQETICELERMHSDLRRDAETDHLTGVGNRRWFFHRAGEELSRARRTRSTFALILLDLDRFKLINDRFGHTAGDDVLRTVTAAVRQCLRGYDCFGRLGGEEFAILLPEADLTGAFVAAERLRARIEQLEIPAIGDHRATASFGVVHLEPSDERIEDLLDRADLALYQAKEGGRNLVVPLEEAPGARIPADGRDLPVRRGNGAAAA